MSSALGRLVASIILDTAEFTVGSDKAKYLAAGTASSIDKTFKDLHSSVRGTMRDVGLAIAAGFGINAIKGYIEAAVNAQASMKDLGEMASISAEAMSKFEAPTRLAGGSLDQTAAAMARLSRAAVEAQDPTSKSAAALSAIGISTAQIKNLSPDQLFELIARSLANYSDGLQKNAIMQQLLGKSGFEMNGVMKQIADTSQLTASVTQDQAEKAKKLEEQIVQLKMNSEQLWRSLASEGVPALNDIIARFLQAQKAGEGFIGSLRDAVSEGFMKASGMDTLKGQLDNVNQQIADAKKTLDYETNGAFSSAFTDSQRTDQAKALNALLAQRDQLVKLITADEHEQFQKELEAQNKRATAGQKQIHFDPAAEAYATGLLTKAEQELAKARAELNGGSAQLTNAEKMLLEIEADPKWATLGEKAKARIKAKLDEAAADEQRAQASKVAADAAAQLEAIDEQTQSEIDKLMDVGKNRLLQLDQTVAATKAENDIMGQSDLAHQLLALDLQKEIALRGVNDEKTREGIAADYDELKALAAQHEEMQSQLSLWGELGDRIATFATASGSKIQSLKQQVSDFFRQLEAFLIKRYILQLGASLTGSSALGAAAGQVGANTLAGSAANSLGGDLLTSVGGNLIAGGISGGSGLLGGVGSTVLESGLSTTLFGSAGLTDTLAFTGTGLSGAVGSAAVAAGASAETAAAIASWVPVIGWVVAIGAILYAAFGNKGGAPKVGGSFMGLYSGAGDFLSNTPVAGSDNGRFFTPNQMDSQMKQLVDATVKGYGGFINALGGKAGSFSFGLGADNDPGGSAQSRVSAMLRDASGKVIYSNLDQNMDDKAVPAALQLESERLMLAALKASDLPAYLAKVFDNLTPSTATKDQIDAAFQTAAALKSIFDIVQKNPLDDLATAMARSTDQLNAAMEANEAQVRAVMNAYDGSAQAATNLQQATAAYYNAQMQLLIGIQNTKAAIDDMFGGSIRSYRMAGLDSQGKYNYLMGEASSLQSQALASSDPAVIQRLAQQIDQDMQAAFGLLSQDQQSANSGLFADRARSTQQLLDNRLEELQKQTADATQAVLGQIRDLIGASDKAQKEAAANQLKASENNLTASATPRQLALTIDLSNGSVIVNGG